MVPATSVRQYIVSAATPVGASQPTEAAAETAGSASQSTEAAEAAPEVAKLDLLQETFDALMAEVRGYITDNADIVEYQTSNSMSVVFSKPAIAFKGVIRNYALAVLKTESAETYQSEITEILKKPMPVIDADSCAARLKEVGERNEGEISKMLEYLTTAQNTDATYDAWLNVVKNTAEWLGSPKKLALLVIAMNGQRDKEAAKQALASAEAAKPASAGDEDQPKPAPSGGKGGKKKGGTAAAPAAIPLPATDPAFDVIYGEVLEFWFRKMRDLHIDAAKAVKVDFKSTFSLSSPRLVGVYTNNRMVEMLGTAIENTEQIKARFGGPENAERRLSMLRSQLDSVLLSAQGELPGMLGSLVSSAPVFLTDFIESMAAFTKQVDSMLKPEAPAATSGARQVMRAS